MSNHEFPAPTPLQLIEGYPWTPRWGGVIKKACAKQGILTFEDLVKADKQTWQAIRATSNMSIAAMKELKHVEALLGPAEAAKQVDEDLEILVQQHNKDIVNDTSPTTVLGVQRPEFNMDRWRRMSQEQREAIAQMMHRLTLARDDRMQPLFDAAGLQQWADVLARDVCATQDLAESGDRLQDARQQVLHLENELKFANESLANIRAQLELEAGCIPYEIHNTIAKLQVGQTTSDEPVKTRELLGLPATAKASEVFMKIDAISGTAETKSRQLDISNSRNTNLEDALSTERRQSAELGKVNQQLRMDLDEAHCYQAEAEAATKHKEKLQRELDAAGDLVTSQAKEIADLRGKVDELQKSNSVHMAPGVEQAQPVMQVAMNVNDLPPQVREQVMGKTRLQCSHRAFDGPEPVAFTIILHARWLWLFVELSRKGDCGNGTIEAAIEKTIEGAIASDLVRFRDKLNEIEAGWRKNANIQGPKH